MDFNSKDIVWLFMAAFNCLVRACYSLRMNAKQ
jgi:hypothetical protein